MDFLTKRRPALRRDLMGTCGLGRGAERSAKSGKISIILGRSIGYQGTMFEILPSEIGLCLSGLTLGWASFVTSFSRWQRRRLISNAKWRSGVSNVLGSSTNSSGRETGTDGCERSAIMTVVTQHIIWPR